MMTTDRQMGHDCIIMLYDIRDGEYTSCLKGLFFIFQFNYNVSVTVKCLTCIGAI